jgi:hypothetical protein
MARGDSTAYAGGSDVGGTLTFGGNDTATGPDSHATAGRPLSPAVGADNYTATAGPNQTVTNP